MARALLLTSFISMAWLSTPAMAALPAEAGKSPAIRATDAKHAPASPKASFPQPQIVVHRDAGCGCCVKWADHLREAGFNVEVRVETDMQAIKDRLGVPKSQRSCHTGVVAGYFVEGHVPAADIRRLLAGRRAGRGIAVGGMPLGSPGMEVPGMAPQPFEVSFVGTDGALSRFASH